MTGENKVCPDLSAYIFSGKREGASARRRKDVLNDEVVTAAQLIEALEERCREDGPPSGKTRQARIALKAYQGYITDLLLAERADMRSRDRFVAEMIVDSEHLNRFCQWMLTDQYARSTITHYLRSIRAAVRHAGYHIDLDPVIEAVGRYPSSPGARLRTAVGVHGSNEEAASAETPQWYALRNHTDLTDSELSDRIKEILGDESAIYNPELNVTRRLRSGRLVTQPGSLLRRIVMVRCSLAGLREIIADPHFAARLHPYSDSLRHPVAIPDRQMEMFRLVITLSNNADAPLDTIDPGRYANAIASGTTVRVLAGPFAGLVGTVARLKRDRRVVVHIPGLCTLATPHIPLQLLQPVPAPTSR